MCSLAHAPASVPWKNAAVAVGRKRSCSAAASRPVYVGHISRVIGVMVWPLLLYSYQYSYRPPPILLLLFLLHTHPYYLLLDPDLDRLVAVRGGQLPLGHATGCVGRGGGWPRSARSPHLRVRRFQDLPLHEVGMRGGFRGACRWGIPVAVRPKPGWEYYPPAGQASRATRGRIATRPPPPPPLPQTLASRIVGNKSLRNGSMFE